MRRRLLILVTLAVVSALWLAATLARPHLCRHLKAYLEELALQRAGLQLTIGELQVELLPPQITLHEVRLELPHQPHIKRITLRSVQANLRPWLSRHGQAVVDRLQLDGVATTVQLGATDAGATATSPAPAQKPTGQTGPERLGFEVRRGILSNSQVQLLWPEGSLSVAGATFSLQPAATKPAGQSISLELVTAVLQHGAVGAKPLKLRAQAVLTGPLAAPQALRLEEAYIKFGGISGQIAGAMALDASGQEQFSVRLAGQGEAWQSLWPELPALRGNIAVRAQLKGPLRDPAAQVQLQVDDLYVGTTRFGRIDLDAGLTPTHINLASLHIDHPAAGELTGSGTLELTGSRHAQLTGRLHRVSLPHVLDMTGVSGAWVRAKISGDVTLEATLKPWAMTIDTHLSVDQFAALDASHQDKRAANVLYLEHVDLTGPVEIRDDAVLLPAITLNRQGSQLQVQGRFDFNTQTGFALQIEGGAFDLAAIGQVADIALAGRGLVRAYVGGPYDQPQVKGFLHTRDAAVLGYPLGECEGEINYSERTDGPTLSFENVTLYRQKGHVRGAGAFNFAGATPVVTARATVTAVELNDLLRAVGLGHPGLERLRAAVSGTAELNGPMEALRGSLQLGGSLLRIDQTGLGAFAVRGLLGSTPHTAQLHVEIEPPSGHVAAHAVWDEDGRLSLSTAVRALPLASLAPLFGNTAMGGSFSGTAELAGVAAQLSGAIDANISKLNIASLALGSTNVHVTVQQGVAAVTGELLDGKVAATGNLTTSGSWPYAADLRFTELAPEQITALPANITALLGGAISVSGELYRANSLKAEATLSRADWVIGGIKMSATQPPRLRFSNGTLQLHDIAWAGENVALQLDGSVDVGAAALDLSLSAGGNAHYITSWMPSITMARGEFATQLRINGPWQSPNYRGTITIHRGQVRLAQGDGSFDNIECRLALAARVLSIEEANADFGGGHLQLTGGASLLPAGLADLNLRATLNSVRLRPVADTDAVVSGELILSGPSQALTLSGRLRAESGRYRANFALEKLLARGDGPPLRVPTITDDRSVALQVKIQAPGNIIILNNVVEAELAADLLLTGTSERPGLIGSVTPLWARVRYRNNKFVLKRGTIDFIDEYRIATQFQMQAETQACGMRVQVELVGSADNLRVIASGQDEYGQVDPQDALACLQLGLRLRNFRGVSSVGLQDSLPGGLDALWTVSGLDQKVRTLLPIRVNEVRLTSNWSSLSNRTTPWVLVGKDVSEKVWLRYARSLTETGEQAFSLEYRLSNRASLQGSWASAREVPVGDFGLDLQLLWEFR